MQSKSFTPSCISRALATAGFGLAAALTVATPLSIASSHREAPFASGHPKVDGTDFYMFRSYETNRDGFVTLLANYQPFQDPQGGPNFYPFEQNGLYEIHIDNNGDGLEDLTFQFRFKNTSKSLTLPVGGKAVKIPLINSGPISGVNAATLNLRETYTIDVVRGSRRSGVNAGTKVTNAAGGATEFDKPVDNIGDKVFGSATAYATYANQHIYSVNIPGCATPGKVFVGQRKEPFFIAVGKIFDLFNLNPLGPETGGNNNDLEAKNVSTLAMEVPISCLVAGTVGAQGTDPVISGYTTASLRQGRLLNGNPGGGFNKVERSGGAWTQVSRLGMPLVNEVVIGLDDKDKFNASRPRNDTAFADYVTNPVLPTLIESLFPSAMAPKNFPRTDLVTVFLKGIEGVNQPAAVTGGNGILAEMMRLNTSTPVTPAATQNPMGVAAGDKAGFPNGRRPGDDVVDASLRVSMGALCVLTGATDTFKVGCKPADAPGGGLLLTDGVRKSAANYGVTFPYLTTPIPGNFNPAAPAGTVYP